MNRLFRKWSKFISLVEIYYHFLLLSLVGKRSDQIIDPPSRDWIRVTLEISGSYIALLLTEIFLTRSRRIEHTRARYIMKGELPRKRRERATRARLHDTAITPSAAL